MRGVAKFRVADLAEGVAENGRIPAELIVENNERVVMLTADHSPESPHEFNRMKTSHPHHESTRRGERDTGEKERQLTPFFLELRRR
eukprot:scaffold2085_cov263-Pinguiococcus_pyrenoidosus.AAC.5